MPEELLHWSGITNKMISLTGSLLIGSRLYRSLGIYQILLYLLSYLRLLRKTTDNEVKELVTGVLWNLSSCDVRTIFFNVLLVLSLEVG